MFDGLANVFKVKDIRRRLFFLLLMIIVIRIGSQLPVPGTDGDYFRNWFDSQSGDAFNFFDAFTGGSFTQMSIFALNITPYITSSIIMQLLTIAIPKLEEMHKDGEEGRKKIASITRYLTIGLSVFEGIAMSIGFGRQGLIPVLSSGSGSSVFEKIAAAFVVVVCLTAGSAMLMWIGERITEKGVGNGISIVLLFNIISSLPNDINTLYTRFLSKGNIPVKIVTAIIILAVIGAMVVFVIVLQDGERRIPVQYSQKMQGRRMVGGRSSSIPLKVNTAGVIPVIFASSIMSFPVVIAQFFNTNFTGAGGWILTMLSSNSWFRPEQPAYSVGLVIYLVLIVVFAYFYTSITFNPLEVANNIKKQGGFIPGIRPGKPTSDYLNNILNYIVFIGACGLMVVSLVPIIVSGLFTITHLSFAGTSLIIIVGVILETIKAIESQMLVRNYTGFLND